MARRLEIELTSDRGDGSWTWRAAGAKQPKGVLDGALLPAGSKPGDVLRVEADSDIDGVTVIAVLAPQEKHRNAAERLEVIGRPQRDEQLVTTTLAPKGRGDRRDRPPRRDRSERGDGPERGDRPPRRNAPGRDAEARDARGRDGDRGGREGRSDRRPPRPRPEEPAKPKPRRLRPARTHRTAVLADLPPEQRPIAEQVLQGDIPAVRQAIDKENEGRAARGEPSINGAELLAIAERLRPRLRTAEWRDRAEAALADVDELDLRDLRSVVVAADSAARDDETRALAAGLREALTRRVDEEHAAWLAELTAALEGGRTVRALRLSSRPPKAGTIFPPDLSARLAGAASAALTSDAPGERWAIVLDAVAHSPVRTAVTPQSLPATPSEELLVTVRKLAGRIPEIAAQLGVEPTEERRSRGPRRPARGARRPAPSAPAKDVEQVEGVAQDDVATQPGAAGVPGRDGEAAAGVERAAPVVVGVADEHHVSGADAEPVENRAEALGPEAEAVGEQGDVGLPAEAGELGSS